MTAGTQTDSEFAFAGLATPEAEATEAIRSLAAGPDPLGALAGALPFARMAEALAAGLAGAGRFDHRDVRLRDHAGLGDRGIAQVIEVSRAPRDRRLGRHEWKESRSRVSKKCPTWQIPFSNDRFSIIEFGVS